MNRLCNGHCAIVETLLTISGDAHSLSTNLSTYGCTLLYLAASSDCLACVKTILKYNPDVNTQHFGGNTPLHVSLQNVSPDIAELILKCPSIDLSLRNNRGYTVLHMAAEMGDILAVERMVAKMDAELVDSRTVDGYSALRLAVTNEHKAVVEVLLSSGKADVDLVDNKNRTPLMEVVIRKNIDILRTLLEFEPNVNIQDSEGFTAVHLAAGRPHCDVAAEFIRHAITLYSQADLSLRNNSGSNALHIAAKAGNKLAVEQIANASPPLVDVLTNDGSTALHLAASQGHKGVVKILTKVRFTDINMADGSKCTPLILAVKERHFGVMELLLANKADVNAQDEDGNTALHLAAKGFDSSKVYELLMADGSINLRLTNNDGYNALHISSIWGDPTGVELVLRNDPDIVDIKTDEGYSALHLAALGGSKDAAEVLITTGRADIDIGDGEGRSPLILAVEQGRTSAIEMLVENGAGVNKCDSNGNTALHRVLQINSSTSVEFLPYSPKIYKIFVEMKKKYEYIPPGTFTMNLDVEGTVVRGEALAVAAYLVQHGADTNLQNLAGKTPLSLIGQLWINRLKSFIILDPEKPTVEMLRGFQAKIEDLEDAVNCRVCLGNRFSVAFSCGHTACTDCSAELNSCHVCRAEITSKNPIYF